MKTRSLRSIYQLKISLKGIHPTIWRRLQVSSVMKLEDLHIVLQVCMGWFNSHLYEFITDSNRYGDPEEAGLSGLKDATNVRLYEVMKNEKDTLLYLYDYGDSWEHAVKLEKILPFEIDRQLPFCLAGENACPPEDVGGPSGYYYFLEVIANPSHPDYEEMRRWVHSDFDRKDFDMPLANCLLSEYS
jgi:hypothetical protein